MITRSQSTDLTTPASPTCWQREAPAACLRVEIASSEAHLFSYQHFITASLKAVGSAGETLHISFSSHEIEIAGSGLRDLLLGLQEFAVKWVRLAPERYRGAATGNDALVTAIRITAAGD